MQRKLAPGPEPPASHTLLPDSSAICAASMACTKVCTLLCPYTSPHAAVPQWPLSSPGGTAHPQGDGSTEEAYSGSENLLRHIWAWKKENMEVAMSPWSWRMFTQGAEHSQRGTFREGTPPAGVSEWYQVQIIFIFEIWCKSWPHSFCSHLFGQYLVIWPHLAAWEAGKWHQSLTEQLSLGKGITFLKWKRGEWIMGVNCGI